MQQNVHTNCQVLVVYQNQVPIDHFKSYRSWISLELSSNRSYKSLSDDKMKR